MSQATLGSGPYRNSSLFSGYYLDERVADLDAWDCDEEAEEAFEQIRDLWNQEGALLPSYKEDELIDTWIAEILDILGYGTSSEVTLPDGGGYVDRLLFKNEVVRRESARQALDSGTEGHFSRALSILEAKQWDADFEKFFSEQRSYRDASHQIKFYLERTPGDLNWGILTDGKKWRLYGTKDYETQTYYEVDLPEILESGNLEAFKYFYVFFRPGAFVKTAGSSFLDDVWSESETAAQELGEDLQDNVFRALRVLGKGFVESNDLEIDPNDENGLSADELKEQSLVLLYRLMFVLYAESRGLIDPDDPAASEEYQEYFSLEAKREEILDEVDGLDVESGAAFEQEFSQYSSSIWGRLSELFELIDEGEEDLDIPPYNGGLFSREDHAFLTENDVKDPYIAEVIYWLSTTENDEGEHVPADYADLDTRHLGSIYEGLLEHEFRIAGPEGVAAVAEEGGQVWKSGDEVSVSDAIETVEEGGLYVVNDEGERKATGAYYTPDYVVTYIVEETVDPLIDEIHEDLHEEGYKPETVEYAAAFFNRVQELSILDPAMGSGHFLTKATGYLSKQVMDEVRALDEQAGFLDEQYIRRQISKEVIYGVDINEMAVELSKLSMWLETLAADQPLAFLDHHLKDGNSLVGSDITEVLSEDGPDGDDDGQITLTQVVARVRQETLEHVMELMGDLLAYDNETLADVKSMEELYDEIRDDPLYTRLFELANVHTAEEFGCDVPEGSYEQMAGAIEDEDDWEAIRGEDWFTAAQATADEQDFFHWELEFPEVFFDSEGEKMSEAGFDVVVGNPPYGYRKIPSDSEKSYYESKYQSHQYNFEFYIYFTERAIEYCRSGGHTAYIIPNTYLSADKFSKFRNLLLSESEISEIFYLGQDVFENVTLESVIQHLIPSDEGEEIRIRFGLEGVGRIEIYDEYGIEQTKFRDAEDSVFGINLSPERRQIVDKMDECNSQLGDLTYTTVGINTGYIRDVLVSDEKENEKFHKMVSGKNIGRYELSWDGRWIQYDPDVIEEYGDKARSLPPEHIFTDDKILLQRTRRGLDRKLVATLDEDEYYNLNRVSNVVLDEDQDYRLDALLGVLNSTLLDRYFNWVFDEYEVKPVHLRKLPIVGSNIEIDTKQFVRESSELVDDRPSNSHKLLGKLARSLSECKSNRQQLNLNLLQYLQPYVEGDRITDIGLFQPTSSTDSMLNGTSTSHENLRVGTAHVDRESPNTVLIKATARYKPDDEDAYETDQWGYTETEYLPAFRITDLTEREADLIEYFVPVAVDEAGGFANFRETATKTNSLIDRLKAMELPDIDDVTDNLENYLRTKERAEELDDKIEQTDQLIDEIVYELYGLTEEEIEIVEEAVGE